MKMGKCRRPHLSNYMGEEVAMERVRNERTFQKFLEIRDFIDYIGDSSIYIDENNAEIYQKSQHMMSA